MVTRAPIAARLLLVPTKRKRTRWFAILLVLSSSEGGSPTLRTTMSIFPLLAMSPKAAPRLDFSVMSASPAAFRNFFERAVAQTAMQQHGLGVGRASFGVAHLRIDVPESHEEIEPAVI